MAAMNNSVKNCYNLVSVHSVQSNDIVAFSAVFTASLCVSIGFGAVFGNILVIYVTYKSKLYKTAQGILLMNLALTDLQTGIFIIPANIVLRMLETQGQHSCFLEMLIKAGAHTLSGVSMLLIVLLAIDRCIAVKFPVKCRGWELKKYFTIAVICSWLYVFLLVGFYLSKVYSLKASRIVAAVNCVVAIICLTVAYSIISYELRQRARRVAQLGTTASQKERQSVITCALIAIAFFIAYAPRISITFPKDEETLYHLSRWSSLGILANSALNPFIYFYRRDVFKTEVLKLVRRLRRKTAPGTVPT